ncbi:hypothetical protein SUGI_0916710 [Cryptomeria japonica]|nr:hypothetical protein SUGI_0916710 [Cryptomeria japonica]
MAVAKSRSCYRWKKQDITSFKSNTREAGQIFIVLLWTENGSSKNSSFWSGLLELWTENAKTFGIFNNLLGFLGGRSPE